jgi:hypothetical protein
MTIFVNQGDQYLTPVQLERRAQKYIRRSWPDQRREKSIRLGDGQFDAFMSEFSTNHEINKTNNTFNWQLQEYGKAVARLDRYVLADGRLEVTEMQPTGEQVFNEDTGEMEDVLHEVVVQTAVEPLPATVEIKVYDEENPTYTEHTEMQPTGEQVYNEETEQFEDVMEEVTIQELVYTVETVDNPEIIRDTEERTVAQVVVDATPDEVKNFS